MMNSVKGEMNVAAGSVYSVLKSFGSQGPGRTLLPVITHWLGFV